MATKTASKKKTGQEDVRLLRSLAISLGEDPEGEYRPDFVKEILKAAHEKPTLEFKDKASFLKQLRKA